RLGQRLHRPGDRFLTARQVADQYAVSYQTAHRLLADLEACGLIERRARSGTFIRGSTVKPTHARLVLHPRATNPQGFGGKLRETLLRALAKGKTPFREHLEPSQPIPHDALPILWESPDALRDCVAQNRPAILINERPPPGWNSALLDSVGADDFAGGALAADTLRRAALADDPFAVLAGPVGDRRSDERIAGFRSRIDSPTIVHADNWHRDAGRRAAEQLLARSIAGVFAANDRLAQGLVMTYRKHAKPTPKIVGYDDAPIAKKLSLTTIALPWQSIAEAVIERTQARLKGDTSPARTVLLQPSIVFHDGCN
ncbi:MAG: substrate-binding domain-containing protein, partial [Phycisphaeraceae bacterium]